MSLQKICKPYLDTIAEWEAILDQGYRIESTGSQGVATTSRTPTTTGISIQASPVGTPSPLDHPLLESAIQSHILQAWTFFLEQMFVHIIREQFHGRRKCEVNLSTNSSFDISWIGKKTTVVELREFLCSKFLLKFSYLGSKEQWAKILSFYTFGTATSSNYNEIRRHFLIRHLCQHNSGRYSKEFFDKQLQSLGFDQGYSFEWFDDASNDLLLNIQEGEILKISTFELKKLCQSIKNLMSAVSYK